MKRIIGTAPIPKDVLEKYGAAVSDNVRQQLFYSMIEELVKNDILTVDEYDQQVVSAFEVPKHVYRAQFFAMSKDQAKELLRELKEIAYFIQPAHKHLMNSLITKLIPTIETETPEHHVTTK